MRAMKITVFVTSFFAAASLAVSVFAQQTTTSPVAGKKANKGQVAVPANPAGGAGASASTGQPSAADMQKMMAQRMGLPKKGENHKTLGRPDGDWDRTSKFW